MSTALTEWFFENFKKGEVVKTKGRTVSETDLAMTVAITGHCQPIFVDEEFAKTTSFGTRIAPAELTMGIMAGLLTRTGVLENQVGLLEISCTFPHPMKANDTVYAEAEIVETKACSDGKRGVVTFSDTLFNVSGDVLLKSHRVAIFLCKNNG